MSVSDEKRREVAQKLRWQASFMRIYREWYEADKDVVECGNRAYRNIADTVIPFSYVDHDYIGIVERLADLIDRPTCRNVSGNQDMFECSECRCMVEIVGEKGNEYGDVFSTPFIPNFCPQCGAEVVNYD